MAAKAGRIGVVESAAIGLADRGAGGGDDDGFTHFGFLRYTGLAGTLAPNILRRKPSLTAVDAPVRMPASVWRSLRSEEHTSELQSLMRISYAVFCLKKKTNNITTNHMTYAITN